MLNSEAPSWFSICLVAITFGSRPLVALHSNKYVTSDNLLWITFTLTLCSPNLRPKVLPWQQDRIAIVIHDVAHSAASNSPRSVQSSMRHSLLPYTDHIAFVGSCSLFFPRFFHLIRLGIQGARLYVQHSYRSHDIAHIATSFAYAHRPALTFYAVVSGKT